MANGRTLNGKWKGFFRDWRLYVLLLPAIVYVFIFSYIPMYGVQIAFRDYSAKRGIWGSNWVGLKHFIRFVTYPNFWQLIGNTLHIGLYSLATFPCSVIFALMLNEMGNQKYKKTVQMVSYMPHFLSTVVVCSMITLFFKGKTGVVNTIVTALGGQRWEYMEEARFFVPIYVWSGVWKGLGFDAIIYLAALSGVNPELVEAARIDGASRMKIVWHVNLPHIIPTVVIMLILSCGSVLSVSYEKILLLQNSLNLSVSRVISTYTYDVGIVGGQFSYSSAIGLFNTIVNVLILSLVNQIAKRVGETSLW